MVRHLSPPRREEQKDESALGTDGHQLVAGHDGYALLWQA